MADANFPFFFSLSLSLSLSFSLSHSLFVCVCVCDRFLVLLTFCLVARRSFGQSETDTPAAASAHTSARPPSARPPGTTERRRTQTVFCCCRRRRRRRRFCGIARPSTSLRRTNVAPAGRRRPQCTWLPFLKGFLEGFLEGFFFFWFFEGWWPAKRVSLTKAVFFSFWFFFWNEIGGDERPFSVGVCVCGCVCVFLCE